MIISIEQNDVFVFCRYLDGQDVCIRWHSSIKTRERRENNMTNEKIDTTKKRMSEGWICKKCQYDRLSFHHLIGGIDEKTKKKEMY